MKKCLSIPIMALIKCPECGITPQSNLKGSIFMKKTITIFLIFSVLLTSMFGGAFAQEFTVRNGICFGMSIEEVKQNEEGKPFEPLPEDYNYEQEEIFYDEGENQLYYMGFKSIAGISSEAYDGANIIYKFLADKLYYIEYRFNVYSETNVSNSYVELRKNLIDKYGEPYNSEVNHISKVSTECIQRMLAVPDFYTIVQVDEWLAAYENYYVVIDEVVWSDGRNNNLELCYNMMTAEELDSIMTETVQQQENKANEVANDL